MRNEFDASTNVMHGDLLQELTDKIREEREEEPAPSGAVVEIEADAEVDWQPTPILGPLVPLLETPISGKPLGTASGQLTRLAPLGSPIESTARVRVRGGSSLWLVALLSCAFTIGFIGTLRVLPVLRYLRAHQALVVPPPAAIPDPPPPELAVAETPVVAEAPVVAAAPPAPVRAPPKHHRKHSRRHH